MRLSRTAAVLVMCTVLLAGGPASAALPTDPRIPLIHQPLNNCELGADALPGTGTPSRGFAITALNVGAPGRLTVGC